MEPLAVAHNDGLAPIVGWTDPSPVDSPLKRLKRSPPPALVIASSPTPSAVSSGIERDADKSTTPSISTYSPTSSSIESEPFFGSTTDCVDNNNGSALKSKDGDALKTKKLISSLKTNNNIENSPYPSSQCIHINEGVKFFGIPDHDSICSVSYNGNDSDDDHKDDDEIEGPKVPDGGWGWMIVAASLVLSTIADGVSFSFGLLYIEFLQYFGESKSKTSWIGGLFMSVPLMSGPIMSALVDKYGCRKITILGGLISAFGFVMATFCNSIEMLLLTFGTIAGLGLGMCYVTAVVSIAYWFDKKRTLAVSLGACGTGIGTFVYAPLTQYLINEYGWRGTVLMLAGTFLNMCVCGTLMRDPEWWTLEQKKQAALSNKSIYGASSCGSVSRLSGGGESVFPGVDELRSLMKSGETPEYILTTLATSIAVAEKLENIPEEKNEQLYNSVVNLPTFVRQNEKVPLEVLESLSSNTKLYNVILENYPSLLTCRSCSENKLNKLPANKPVTKVPVTMSLRLKASKKPPLKNNEFTECNRDIVNIPLLTEEKILKPIIKQSSVKSPIKTQEPWLIRQFSTNQHYLRDIKMHRNSVMYRGAMMNIAKYKLRASSCPNIYRNSMIHIDYEDETKWYSSIMETMTSTFDFQMFLEFHFLLMSLGTMLLFICFIVPYFCIAEHMTRNGYDEDDGAMQISIIGITNTIGMIFLGWAGDQPWMNVTKSYAVCLVLCGIATLAYPFVINSYYLLITMSILFGLTFASSFSFTPVILVELIPLERFTTAYGLILLCQGIGNLLGPPISGWLFDVTQSWDLSFYLAGIFTMLAGVLIGIIPMTKNFRIWGSAPLEKDLEKISQMSQKDSISIA